MKWQWTQCEWAGSWGSSWYCVTLSMKSHCPGPLFSQCSQKKHLLASSVHTNSTARSIRRMTPGLSDSTTPVPWLQAPYGENWPVHCSHWWIPWAQSRSRTPGEEEWSGSLGRSSSPNLQEGAHEGQSQRRWHSYPGTRQTLRLKVSHDWNRRQE